jgi:hypothetical protein
MQKQVSPSFMQRVDAEGRCLLCEVAAMMMAAAAEERRFTIE